MLQTSKTVLIFGANSDVARQCMLLYSKKQYKIIAASRSTNSLKEFANKHDLPETEVKYFDAVDFASHQFFYDSLKEKPHIVVYAAGFLVSNEEAIMDWERTYQMINVHYSGAVSILNVIASDKANNHLERIIGLSSLSGVRGRKSNFVYGSSKSAFTQYLAGMRQHLFSRNVKVSVIIAGYIRSKMTAGLDLTESLMLEPEFIAKQVVNCRKSFVYVPGFKWKIIYYILKILPESLVAKLP